MYNKNRNVMSENIKNDKNNKNNFLEVLLEFIESDLPANIKNNICKPDDRIRIGEFIGIFTAMHVVYKQSDGGTSLCVKWNDITNEVLIEQLNKDYSTNEIWHISNPDNNTDDNKTMSYEFLKNLSKNELDKEEQLKITYDNIIKVGGEKIYQNLFYLFSCAYLTDCYDKLLQVVSDKYEKLQDKKLKDELLKVMFNITKDSTENHMIEVFLRLIGKYKCTTTDDFLTKHKGTLFYRDLQNKKLQYESELATHSLENNKENEVKKNNNSTLSESINTDNISNDELYSKQSSSTVSQDNKTESNETKNEESEVKKNNDLTLGEGVNTNNISNDDFVEVPYSKQPSSTVSPDNKTESKETKSEAIEDYERCCGCFLFHKKKGSDKKKCGRN